MTFLENGTKLFALNPKSFVFIPEKSAGDPEVDLLRTINIPFVVSAFTYGLGSRPLADEHVLLNRGQHS